MAEQAYAIGLSAQNFPLRVNAAVRIGFADYALGQYGRVIDLFREHKALLTGDLLYERFGHVALPAVHFRGYLALSLVELGEFSEAVTLADEGLSIAQTANHTLSRLVAGWCLGAVVLLKGDIRRAITVLDEAVRLAEETKFIPMIRLLMPVLSLARAQGGHPREMLPRLEAVIEAAEGRTVLLGQPACFAALAQCYLMANRVAEAAATARRADDLARRQGERGQEGWILHLLGEISSRQDTLQMETAEAYYGRVSDLARERRMRPLIAHCHLGLGKLYRRPGKRDQAREHLTSATTMFREMDMRFWLEQAEAEMTELA